MATEPRRGPGRPKGSVGLTAEIQEQVLTLLRGGASLPGAAATVGVPVRTMQGWVARGSGRAKESSTPKLRRFAKAVEQARAEARVSAEVRLHKSQPARWLHAGIASEDPGAEDDDLSTDPARVRELAKQVRDALLYIDPNELVPPCPNRRCRCVFHTERTPEEMASIQELIAKGDR